MPEVLFENRRAAQIENDRLRVTVLVEGGHVAEILHKPTGVNPLWIPPWPSIEPSSYDRARHPEYGDDAESKLLAGIMGHNVCLDLFGGPSLEEAAAGMTVHGEASILPYQIEAGPQRLVQRTTLPSAHLAFEREIRLAPGQDAVVFRETVENLDATDRPIAWTQHVTLGPPFLRKGETRFAVPATRSRVYELDFAGECGFMQPGAEFDWPLVPLKDGGREDLRTYTGRPASGGFTTHLMDPARRQASFLAFTSGAGLLFGYVWERQDFPWLGIWEENHCRQRPPWNGQTLTRGMEFGVSPMPESRRQMIERNNLFGVSAYRWLPAKSRLSVSYCAFLTTAGNLPSEVTWYGETIGFQ